MNLVAKAQIRYLEILRDNNLLDLALEGKLPPDVERAAKHIVILDMKGAKVDNTKTTLLVSEHEHAEAEREVEEFLRHYKLLKNLERIERSPRNFTKKRKYVVQSGYFQGKSVTYRGTDQEVFGTDWLSNFGHPACERFLFRAQRDGIDPRGRILVFNLDSEDRDILLHEKEIGAIIQ